MHDEGGRDAGATDDPWWPDPDGPHSIIVPPDLVPGIEVPASPTPAPLWQSLAVAVAFLAVLAGIVIAGVSYADRTWSPRQMELTALRGVEALIAGDPERLAEQSTGAVRDALTPSVRERMRTAPPVRFSQPVSRSGSIVVKASVDGSQGTLVMRPDYSNGTVSFTTTGALGAARGDVDMVIDVSGWKIGGVRVR